MSLAAKRIIYGAASAMLLFLTIMALFFSSDGYVISANGINTLFALLLCLAVLIVLGLLVFVLEKTPASFRTFCLLLVFALVMCFCGWWIKNSANLPQSDEKSIYDIAVRARDHDLLPFAPTGSYMSLWPFQAGLVLFEETILRLIPDADEMTIQWIYMPFMALSLLSAYMAVRKMFSSVRTRILWVILMGLCFPYYFYINNMYGEVPGIALLFFALWMLMEYIQRERIIFLLLSGIGIAGSIIFRKNSLIFLIACCLILLTLFWTDRKRKYLLATGALILFSIAASVFPRTFYETRAHNTMGPGVPAVAYIAMGLQWSEGRDAGNWNGFHSDLYINSDYDEEYTSEVSKESIKESLAYMGTHPGYTISFYFHKLLSQWGREDYMCLYSTLDFYGDRSPAAWNIYQGNAKNIFMRIISIHQDIVYFGALCFCVTTAFARKKRLLRIPSPKESGEFMHLILLVTFIGGFLFSMLWEGGARYVLPYFVMLTPYAAEGLGRVYGILENAVTRRFGLGNAEV